MRGRRLHVEDEFFIRTGGVIGRTRGVGTQFKTGARSSGIDLAVNGEERSRGDQRQHGGPIELTGEARSDAIVEGAHKRGPGLGDRAFSRRRVEGLLNRFDAGTPRVVRERPLEALHTNAGHRNRDARIDRGGEVSLNAALRKTDQADPFRRDIGTRLEVINESHNVPRGIEKERETLASAESAEDGLDVFGGLGGGSGVSARAVVTSINCDTDKAGAGQFIEQRALRLFVATGTVQRNDDGASVSTCAFDENTGYPLTGLSGEAEGALREALAVDRRGDLARESDPRAIDELQESRAGRGCAVQRAGADQQAH